MNNMLRSGTGLLALGTLALALSSTVVYREAEEAAEPTAQCTTGPEAPLLSPPTSMTSRPGKVVATATLNDRQVVIAYVIDKALFMRVLTVAGRGVDAGPIVRFAEDNGAETFTMAVFAPNRMVIARRSDNVGKLNIVEVTGDELNLSVSTTFDAPSPDQITIAPLQPNAFALGYTCLFDGRYNTPFVATYALQDGRIVQTRRATRVTAEHNEFSVLKFALVAVESDVIAVLYPYADSRQSGLVLGTGTLKKNAIVFDRPAHISDDAAPNHLQLVQLAGRRVIATYTDSPANRRSVARIADLTPEGVLPGSISEVAPRTASAVQLSGAGGNRVAITYQDGGRSWLRVADIAEKALHWGEAVAIGKSAGVGSTAAVTGFGSGSYLIAGSARESIWVRVASQVVLSGPNFTAGRPEHLNAVPLSQNRFLISYIDAADGSKSKAMLARFHNGQISYGPVAVVNNVYSINIAALSLPDERFVILYGTPDAGKAMLARPGSGRETFALGGESTFSATAVEEIVAAAPDSTHLLVAYRTYREGAGVVEVVLGKLEDDGLFRFGKPVPIDGPFLEDLDLAALSPQQFVLAFRTFDHGEIVAGSIRDGAIQLTGRTTFARTPYEIALEALTHARFAVAFRDADWNANGAGKIIAGEHDGSLRIGPAAVFNATHTSAIALKALAPNRVALAFQDSASKGATDFSEMRGVALTAALNPDLSIKPTQGSVFHWGPTDNIAALMQHDDHLVIAHTLGSAIQLGTAAVASFGPTSGELKLLTRSSGMALRFNGCTQYVKVANAPGGSGVSMNPRDQLTIEAWIRPRLNNSLQAIVSRPSSSGATGYALRISEGRLALNLSSGAQELLVLDPNRLSPYDWHHVAASYGAGIARLYVDGQLRAERSGIVALQPTSEPLTIGHESNALGRWYDGEIDEVRVWSAVVDGRTISAWRNRPVDSAHPAFSSLVGYWSFDDGAGSRASDGSKNKLHGVLIGMDDTRWIPSGAWYGPEQ